MAIQRLLHLHLLLHHAIQLALFRLQLEFAFLRLECVDLTGREIAQERGVAAVLDVVVESADDAVAVVEFEGPDVG